MKRTHRNGSLVHGTVATSEEDIHQDRHDERREVHAKGRSDKQSTPDSRVVVFDFLQAHLGPRVSQIHQQNETEKEEEHGADERDVMAVNEEERLGDEERHDDKGDPQNDLGAPEAVLEDGPTIFR